MEHLLVVGGTLAAATFATGLLLPVLARREVSQEAQQRRDASLAAEAALRR